MKGMKDILEQRNIARKASPEIRNKLRMGSVAIVDF